MTLEQRVQEFIDRGFEELPAQVLVLMEESAVAVFSALGLFGGATLVLFHASPRLSRDLDFWPEPMRCLPPRNCRTPLRNEYRRLPEFIATRLYWGFQEKRTRHGQYKIAEPEKALLDWIYLKRQEGLPVALDELNLGVTDREKLLRYGRKYPKSVQESLLSVLSPSEEVSRQQSDESVGDKRGQRA